MGEAAAVVVVGLEDETLSLVSGPGDWDFGIGLVKGSLVIA